MGRLCPGRPPCDCHVADAPVGVRSFFDLERVVWHAASYVNERVGGLSIGRKVTHPGGPFRQPRLRRGRRRVAPPGLGPHLARQLVGEHFLAPGLSPSNAGERCLPGELFGRIDCRAPYRCRCSRRASRGPACLRCATRCAGRSSATRRPTSRRRRCRAGELEPARHRQHVDDGAAAVGREHRRESLAQLPAARSSWSRARASGRHAAAARNAEPREMPALLIEQRHVGAAPARGIDIFRAGHVELDRARTPGKVIAARIARRGVHLPAPAASNASTKARPRPRLAPVTSTTAFLMSMTMSFVR